jgi:hypothetical protein
MMMMMMIMMMMIMKKLHIKKNKKTRRKKTNRRRKKKKKKKQKKNIFLISNFPRVLNHVYVLLGVSKASDSVLPTFRNPLSGPSSKSRCGV